MKEKEKPLLKQRGKINLNEVPEEEINRAMRSIDYVTQKMNMIFSKPLTIGQENKEDEFLTVKDLVKLLHLSTNTIQARCRDGTIPSMKIGHKWLIHRGLLFRKFYYGK